MAALNEAYSANWQLFKHNTFPEALYYIHIAWSKKIIYFESPKVASTTMKSTLMQFEWNVSRQMSFADLHDRQFSPLLSFLQVPSLQEILSSDDFIKVALVRNPFTRLLAAYLDQIKQRDADRLSNIIPFLGRHRHDMNAEITFPEFVEGVCRQPGSLMDPHWRPQHIQLYTDCVKYDKIGKLEYIAEFFSYLEKVRPGISKSLAIQNWHQSNALSKLTDFYTPSLAEKVAEKFSIDFETFSYSKKLGF